MENNKTQEESLSPYKKFWAGFTYFNTPIMLILTIGFIIWFLYYSFGKDFFKVPILSLLLMYFTLAIFLFLLYIGTLRNWKWVKIAEYILLLIAIVFLVRSIIIDGINKSKIESLFTLVLIGIIFLEPLIRKFFLKNK